MMTEDQRDRLRQALGPVEREEVAYFELVGYRFVERPSRAAAKAGNGNGKAISSPREQLARWDLIDELPTEQEVIALALEARASGYYKFALIGRGPKGESKPRNVTFDPPEVEDVRGPGNGHSDSDLAVVAHELAAIHKDTAGVQLGICKELGDQNVKLMGAVTGLVERVGGVLDRVVGLSTNMVELQRAHSTETLDLTRSALTEQHELVLTAAELQHQLEAEQSKGAIGPELLRALLDEPEKLEKLIAAGVGSADKVIRLARAGLLGGAK